jgi:membrane protein DedA with SNARE-associated domain
MQSALDWLATLPPELLYPTLLAVAAIENFVPPFPADVAVAFGAFVAAQGEHRMALVFLFAWTGNVAGALVVYQLARRYGAERLARQIAGQKAGEGQARFTAMFTRYGVPALFLARFIPGVRALVPPAAGALRVPPATTAITLAAAAAIWYGVIIIVAYRAGANWDQLKEGIGEFSKSVGVGALVVLTLGLVIWAVVRGRQNSK